MSKKNIDVIESNIRTDITTSNIKKQINKSYTKTAIKDLKKQLKKRSVEKDGYEITKHIADGHAASVFLAQKDDKDYVLKIMAPSLFPGRIMYRLFFQEEHGYYDKNAVDAAFWRGKLVNRITKQFDSDIDILDMVEQSKEFNGFYRQFIKHESAKTLEEKAYVLEKATKLKDFFNEIGMPSWSFNPDYPFYRQRSDNLRLNKEKLIIIDYESAVLTPRKEGGLDLDPVDFDSVGKYIGNNKQNLVDCLGGEEFKVMEESLEKCKHYTELWHSGEKRTLQRIMSKKELQKTIDNLVSEGILLKEETGNLNSNEMTNYVLKNLGVHLGIGFTVGLFTGPIPVGLFPRGAWTIGNRIYHEIKRNKEKAKIHSIGVLGWSSIPIPVMNYFGYLLPLKKINETNALVYGEHITRVMKGKSLGEYLNSKGKVTRGLVKKAIIPKDKRSFYEKNEAKNEY